MSNAKQTVYVINGPSLNLLGKRQPDIYGNQTLGEVEKNCQKTLGSGFDLKFRQSNCEGQIIDWIHEARLIACAIIINPSALTHTSLAILDALNTFEGHVIEVHISNIQSRESFLRHSYVSLRADGVVAGLGVEGYEVAARRIVNLCSEPV